jgi:riboflavin transporter FmnP
MTIGVVWAVDVLVAAASWALVWIGRETTWVNVDEPAIVGLALSVIGISTLVGFYGASPDDSDTKMRSALASGFTATYIYLLASLLVIPEFAESLGDLANDILNGFTVMVTTIVGFYFTSRAVENVSAGIQARKTAEAVAARGGTLPVQAPRGLRE